MTDTSYNVPNELRNRSNFADTLAENGYTDVLVLSRESGADALDGNRLELLDYLSENNPGSVREVAHDLGRNKSNVSDDLNRLWELGIIEYMEGTHGAKAPRLRHAHVVIEPIA